MGLGRIDGGGSGGARLALTKAEVLAELRHLGELGDPDHPRYAEIRPAAIEAFESDHFPRTDAEQAGRIFDAFRRRPQLIPAAGPAGEASG